MSPALTAKYQTFISSMSKQNNEDVPRVYPLTTATEIIELDAMDLILPDGFDDPQDFIIELGNESEDLQYIAEKNK